LPERLQKIIAAAGIASRRAAETLILQGRVSVNGMVVTELGTKANAGRDDIRVDGKLISTDVEKVYLMLNKPRGYVTTLKDPEGRPTVKELLRGLDERVFPVGRLDYDSEGLLLLTNDGDFAQSIQHPRYGIPRTYRVKVRGNLARHARKEIEDGVELEDGLFKPDALYVEKMNPKSSWVVMTIREGRNRVIRRLFDALGYPVARLIRISLGELQLGKLKEGEFRTLRKGETERLLYLSGRKGKTVTR
jgi:23S rRNA pseudouridine2605 synthase